MGVHPLSIFRDIRFWNWSNKRIGIFSTFYSITHLRKVRDLFSMDVLPSYNRVVCFEVLVLAFCIYMYCRIVL